jgi:hypothetical protein
MGVNAALEVLRDIMQDLVIDPDTRVWRPLTSREVLGRALLDVPHGAWTEPVVRDYCAQDTRFAAIRGASVTTAMQWAELAQASLRHDADVVAARWEAAHLEKVNEPLCEALSEVWRRKGHAERLGDLGGYEAWAASMRWVGCHAPQRSSPAFSRAVRERSASCHWSVTPNGARPEVQFKLGVGVWWEDGAREINIRMGAANRAALREGGRTFTLAPLEALDQFTLYGWLTAHLAASDNPAAKYLAQLLRGGEGSARELAALL